MTAIVALVTIFFCSNAGLANYTGTKKNPDGTWVVGGAYTGAQKNPDGTWVCGWKTEQIKAKMATANKPVC